MKFSIIPYDSDDYYKAVSFREAILRQPIGLVFTEDEIAAEKDWVHITAFKDGAICATAALAPDDRQRAKLCRVAVAADLQGQGIGSSVLGYVENYAAAHGFQEIYLHARDSAVDFYRKHHYITDENWFEEDTVPHLKLSKMIASSM